MKIPTTMADAIICQAKDDKIANLAVGISDIYLFEWFWVNLTYKWRTKDGVKG